MALKEFVASLTQAAQYRLALRLCRLALPLWEEFAAIGNLTYRDSVVGMAHTTDKSLPSKALGAVEQYLNYNWLQRFLNGKRSILEYRHLFREPIVALQDGDWELPYPVLKAFYAIYNLLEALNVEAESIFGEPTLYVSINQASDALESSGTYSFDEINEIILAAKS